jgi:hypothetical protein
VQPPEQANKSLIASVHDGHNKTVVPTPSPLRADILPELESALSGKRHRDISACHRNLEHSG